MRTEQTNVARVAGTIATRPTTFDCCGETFYSFTLNVKRSSGNIDAVPVNISKYLLGDAKVGDSVAFTGQIRTYQKFIDGKNRLIITFFALSVDEYAEDINDVELIGFFCKEPQHRITPLGRDICDVMLAVNRSRGKSDYIPCIVWGRTSRHIATLEIGSEVRAIGRLQSRQYVKTDADGNQTERTAYEVSINRINAVGEEICE